MGNTKIWIVILFLFIAVGIFGIQAGWFTEIEVQEKENNGWVLTGIEYEGKLDTKAFGSLYDSIVNEKRKGNLKGDLAALFFESPNTDSSIKAIVGVLSDHSQNSPKKYIEYKQSKYKEIYSTILLGEMFTPNPHNVVELLIEEADKKYSDSKKLFLEYYPNESTVIQSIVID